jgi:hypothetical protein
MKFALVASKVAFVAVLVAAVCFAADGPTVTVKGYVLDSACAFTKGLSKPISKQCAVILRERGVSSGHSCRRWNHLLANCGYHTIDRTEPETSALCGRQSHCDGESL